MTAVPLGQLRRECGEWRSNRWYRPLGVAPFLLPALHDVWPAHAEFLQETFGVPRIYCLLPRFELWSKRPENIERPTSNFEVESGHCPAECWGRASQNLNEMPRIGLPAPKFLDSEKRNP